MFKGKRETQYAAAHGSPVTGTWIMYRFREGGERPYRMQRRSLPCVLVFVKDTTDSKKEAYTVCWNQPQIHTQAYTVKKATNLSKNPILQLSNLLIFCVVDFTVVWSAGSLIGSILIAISCRLVSNLQWMDVI